MSNNRFVGDKNILHNFQETMQSRNDFYDKLSDLAHNLDYVRKKLEEAQNIRGACLTSLDPNMLGSKEEFSNIKEACKMQKEFIRQVSSYGYMDSIFIDKIQLCDSNCANYIDQAINEKGGIACVNGRDNIYTVDEYYDTPSGVGNPLAVPIYPTRIRLDEYLKMDESIPPNLKTAIDQLGKLRRAIENKYINELNISEEEKEIKRIDLQQKVNIDLIYENNTIINDLISTYAREHGHENVKKSALFHLGVGITSLILAIPTGGASLYVASAFEVATLGADFTYSLTTGRDYYTHQRLNNADLLTKGMFTVLGILMEASTLVEPIKAIAVSKGLGKKAAVTELSTASSDIKVVKASKETLDSGLSSAKSFANNLDKQANGIVSKADKLADIKNNSIIQKIESSAEEGLNHSTHQKIPFKHKEVKNNLIAEMPDGKNGNHITQIVDKEGNSVFSSDYIYLHLTDEEVLKTTLEYDEYISNAVRTTIDDLTNGIKSHGDFREFIKQLSIKQTVGNEVIDFRPLLKAKIFGTYESIPKLIDDMGVTALCRAKEGTGVVDQIAIFIDGNRVIDIDFDQTIHWHVWERSIQISRNNIIVSLSRSNNHHYGTLDLNKLFERMGE